MTERDDPEPQPFGVLPSRRRYAAVERVDPEEVLDRLVELDVQGWEAPTGADRRLGPAAEEFHEAFDLGADADHIAAGDADGVSLAAIQGLTTRVATQRERSSASSTASTPSRRPSTNCATTWRPCGRRSRTSWTASSPSGPRSARTGDRPAGPAGSYSSSSADRMVASAFRR